MDLKFAAQDLMEVCGCTESTLKDLTRNWKGNPPLLKAEWPAEGKGHKSFFSFANLMQATIILKARDAKIERAWVKSFVESLTTFRLFPRVGDPFNINYLGEDVQGSTGLKKIDQYINEHSVTQTNLILRPGVTDKGQQYLFAFWEIIDPKIEERPEASFDYWVKQKNGNWKEAHPGPSTDIYILKANAPITMTLHLNQIHFIVKSKLRSLGLF